MHYWTPTISHYLSELPADFEEADSRFVMRDTGQQKDGGRKCKILMEVDDPDAEGDPNARAVLAVYLAQDKGYWRVTHVGFDQPVNPGPAPAPGRRTIIEDPRVRVITPREG